MSKEKKSFIRLLLLTVILFILISSPVAASVAGFVAKGSDGSLFEYGYDDLLDSYALKILGLSNGLYEDFAGKNPYALLNSAGGYIDYGDVLDHYAAALIFGQKFDLSRYVESKEAKRAQMPPTIALVKINSGQLALSDKKVPASNIESNPANNPSDGKTPIAGSATVTVENAQQWAKSRESHQRFIDIAPLYWSYGEMTGLRPEVLYAQAAIETNFGKYDNRVPPEYNNWAGIKLADASGDTPGDHEVFALPEDGVRAHFNHMSAYVGLDPLGEPHARYHIAAAQTWGGKVAYVEELSGKWTPLPDYHQYLLLLLEQMGAFNPQKPDSGPQPEENEPDSSNESGNNSSGEIQVAVDVDVLRLRSGPSIDHDILARLTRGTVLKVTGNQDEWLEVITPGGQKGWVHGAYVREVDLSVNPFKGKIIVIDAGHGGSDPGAIGFSGFQEKVVNFAVAQNLVTLLKAAGAEVIVTRTGDQSVSNQQRVDLANNAKADLYLSIHANAFSNPESNGTETHYCGKNENSSASRFLAQQLQRELVSALQLRDRGVKANSFFVLTKTNMPSALVELGFMTNPQEEELLRQSETHKKAAQALYHGLEAYLLNFR